MKMKGLVVGTGGGSFFSKGTHVVDGCGLHCLGQVCSLKGDLKVLGPSVLEAHLALGLSPRVDLNASQSHCLPEGRGGGGGGRK